MVIFNRRRIALGLGTEISGTNNTAELIGMIQGLNWLRQKGFIKRQIQVFSDSTYAVNSFKKWRWLRERYGYITRDGRPVKNVDIIKRGCQIIDEFDYYPQFHWVKGHSGNRWNIVCDRLANIARTYKIPSIVISKLSPELTQQLLTAPENQIRKYLRDLPGNIAYGQVLKDSGSRKAAKSA